MVKIGWLQDTIDYVGGAEISTRILRARAPDWAEIVHCPANKRPPEDVDLFVIQNCVQYPQRWIQELELKPVVKQVRDPWFAGDAVLRRWLLDHAALMTFNSPIQLEKFGYSLNVPTAFIPPPVDIATFRTAALPDAARGGCITVGAVGPTKGIHLAIDYALVNDESLDIYGQGNYRMWGKLPPSIQFRGRVPYTEMPAIMGSAAKFLFFPQWTESFGRVVVEAWAAGCEMVTSGDIGALWWIENEPDSIERGADIFWDAVGEVVR